MWHTKRFFVAKQKLNKKRTKKSHSLSNKTNNKINEKNKSENKQKPITMKQQDYKTNQK